MAGITRTPAIIALRASFRRTSPIDSAPPRRPTSSAPILGSLDALRTAAGMLIHATAVVLGAWIGRAPVTFIPRDLSAVAPGSGAAAQILAGTVGPLSRTLTAHFGTLGQ